MASNSESETKKYSRPCFSCPRGARVVWDTDGCTCESSSSKALTRLDLPAPLGAATTNRLPGYSIRLFYVLYLLAHLLDQHFHVDRDVGEFQRRRFGAQRVGFTVQFLNQKVKPLADLAAFLDESLQLI